MSLTFQSLRRANIERDVEIWGALDPTRDLWEPADWMTALVGEVGELANKLKKMRLGETIYAADLAEELADIQTYLDLLALCLGFDLGEVTIEKWNRVSERVGSTVRLAGG